MLAHGRWFSPGTPASSTTKSGRHDIAEILLKVALNTKNQIKYITRMTGVSSLPCGSFTVVSLISAHSEIYYIRFLWYSILVVLHGYSGFLHQYHCSPWWNLLLKVALNIITHYPSLFCYFVDSLLVVTTCGMFKLFFHRSCFNIIYIQ